MTPSEFHILSELETALGLSSYVIKRAVSGNSEWKPPWMLTQQEAEKAVESLKSKGMVLLVTATTLKAILHVVEELDLEVGPIHGIPDKGWLDLTVEGAVCFAGFTEALVVPEIEPMVCRMLDSSANRSVVVRVSRDAVLDFVNERILPSEDPVKIGVRYEWAVGLTDGGGCGTLDGR